MSRQSAVRGHGSRPDLKRLITISSWLNPARSPQNCTGGQSGALQVGSSGTASGGVLQLPLGQTGISITKSGYLYIYVSNATPGWDVFFDNLSVKTYAGPMLEEDHYYPLGLTMVVISDKAIKTNYAENKYRYNGIEYDSTFGLDEYEAYFRDLDPQTGRWWQIDPKSDDRNNDLERWSPYASNRDNPILNKHPKGDCPTCIVGFFIGMAVDIGAQMIENSVQGKPITDINFTRSLVAGVAGALTSGVSAFSEGTVEGTMVATKTTVALMAVDASASVANQISENSASGKPLLDISPVRTILDVGAGRLGDHLANPIVLSSNAPKLNAAVKTATSDAVASGVGIAAGAVKPIGSKKIETSTVTPEKLLMAQPDATAHKIKIQNLIPI